MVRTKLALDHTNHSFILPETFELFKKNQFDDYSANWKRALWQVLFTIVPLILVFCISAFAYLQTQLLLPVICLVMGIYFHKLSILLHDVAHMNFFPSRKLNIVLGNILAWFCLTDFKSFRKSHLSHHAQAGQHGDQEIGEFIKESNSRRLIVYLLQNLFGLKLTNGNPARLSVLYSKSFFGLLFTQGLLLALLFFTTGSVIFSMSWCISAITFGVFFSRLRAVLEHFNPSPGGEMVTRSHHCNAIETFLFFGGYMKYHVEHHLAPGIPSYYLPDFSKNLKPHLKKDAISTSAFRTISSMLKLKNAA